MHLTRDAPETRRILELVSLYKAQALRKLIDSDDPNQKAVETGLVRAYEKITRAIERPQVTFDFQQRK